MADFTREQQERMQTYKKQFIDKINNLDPVAVLGLQKAKHGGYICPICSSGARKNGTGISIGRRGQMPHLTCFSKGCFDNGSVQGSDIFGCIKIITGKTENEILQEHFPNYDIKQALAGTYSTDQTADRSDFDKLIAENEKKRQERAAAPDQQEPAADYTEFFKQAIADNQSNGGTYLKGRGISFDIQNQFGIGYCSKWKHPKAPTNAPEREYVIFPTSAGTYTARYAGREDIEPTYKKMKAGSNSPAFGAKQADKALSEGLTDIVFIVEGETDCLSVWECGGVSIATGSITGNQKAVDFAREHKQASYIIAYDNEQEQAKADNVKQAAERLKAGLDEIGVISAISFLSGRYKDTNERLQADKDGLKKDIKQAFYIFLQQNDIVNNVNAMQDFENFVQNRTAPISTGFPNLDKQIGGGVYSGQLIALGAESSMGKTTLLLQMADNMAAAGNPVLFFSLEQSRFELIAKSLCREYNKRLEIDIGSSPNLIQQHYKSNLDISDRGKLKYFDEYEKIHLQKAKERYLQTIAGNMYINEGRTENGEIFSINDIEKTIRVFTRHTAGKRPIVFIDYLQILSADTERPTDETTKVNRTVSALRRICREHDITIFVISSLNRDSYNKDTVTPITESSFKQSGTIEYSADILLAWEYAAVGSADKVNKRDEEQKTPRNCRIKVLKNRNGKRGGISVFKYYAENQHIVEDQTANKAAADNLIQKLHERAAEQPAKWSGKE